MNITRRLIPCLGLALTVACTPTGTYVIEDPRGDVDSGVDAGIRPDGRVNTDTPVTSDMPAVACRDTDGDGLSDEIEGAPDRDTDSDGMRDYMDTDSDNDGFLDVNEANRTYPGYSMGVRIVCGGTGDNCDAVTAGLGDSVPNYRDLDSDDDGLTDREEFMAQTNPCSADTDGDRVTDLIETSAMSDPRMATSVPPENSLYVVLPHYPAPMMGPHYPASSPSRRASARPTCSFWSTTRPAWSP